MEPSRDDPADDLRPEYDLRQLRGGVRGKYARKMAHGDGYEQTAGSPSPNGTGKLNHEQIRAFLQHVSDTLRPRFARCVVPISSFRTDKLEVFGTGTLFRVGGISFLVTASHVVERGRDEGRDLAICDARAGAMALPLHGRISGHTTHDVAIIELPPELVAELPNRSFLSIHEADRNTRRPQNGTYCLHGFPAVYGNPNESRTKLIAVPFTSFHALYQGATNTFEAFDAAHHVLIDAAGGGEARLDTSPMQLPDRLNGMSGCSIWQVYYEGLSTKRWTPDDAVVVGVQTGVYKNGTVIRGTRWHVVDQVIRYAYPDLAGPLDLHIPMRGT